MLFENVFRLKVQSYHLAMIYVLAFPKFDASITKALEGFRSRYEPERSRLVRPHLTLVFGLDNADPQSMSRACARVAAKSHRFEISFDAHEIGRDPFENIYKIFLMCGVGNAQATLLHQLLSDGLRQHQPGSGLPYSPHMTIGANKDRRILEEADPGSIGDFPITGLVDELHVVQVTSGSLQTLDFYKLEE